eukprot:6298821-Pyramimonas_sp.AAC.1
MDHVGRPAIGRTRCPGNEHFLPLVGTVALEMNTAPCLKTTDANKLVPGKPGEFPRSSKNSPFD